MNNNNYTRMKYSEYFTDQRLVINQRLEIDDPLSDKFKKLKLEEQNDPHLSQINDKNNEKWMQYHYPKLTTSSTDAILSCPYCFTILSNDCQRHEVYSNQYRAMFVFNCKVTSDIQQYKRKRQWQHRRKNHNNRNHNNNYNNMADINLTEEMMQNLRLKDEEYEIFYPVKCAVCTTEVGVFDENEIYHFYNILAGY